MHFNEIDCCEILPAFQTCSTLHTGLCTSTTSQTLCTGKDTWTCSTLQMGLCSETSFGAPFATVNCTLQYPPYGSMHFNVLSAPGHRVFAIALQYPPYGSMHFNMPKELTCDDLESILQYPPYGSMHFNYAAMVSGFQELSHLQYPPNGSMHFNTKSIARKHLI